MVWTEISSILSSMSRTPSGNTASTTRHLVCETSPHRNLFQSVRIVRADAVLGVVRACGGYIAEIGGICPAVVDAELVQGILRLQIPDISAVDDMLSVYVLGQQDTR